MAAAYEFYLNGIEQALGNQACLAGDELTIADIAFVCDTGQFLRERRMAAALDKQGFEPVSGGFADDYPGAHRHLLALADRPAFARHLGSLLEGL